MKKITALVLAASVFLISCNQYEKTGSGFAYKITSKGSKNKISQGKIIKYNIELKLVEKDTILQTTKGKLPAYLLVDSARMIKYFFTEIVTQCAEGDKIDFNLSVDSLKNKKMIPDYDKLFTKGSTVHGKVEIIKVFASEKEANDDYAKEMAVEQQRRQKDMEKEIAAQQKRADSLKPAQIKELQDYLKKNNITAQQTPEGMFVEIQNPGTGPKADSGKVAAVLYRGTLLNGSFFDGNMGAGAKSNEPYPVTIGQHGVIPGWEIGLKYLAKGGKARFFIPAILAYGEQGNPPVIPANAGLVFEIEVKDVTDPATAQKVQPVPNK
jgi:FKBP-type peptidyl-prolyl cis-trans isomerase